MAENGGEWLELGKKRGAAVVATLGSCWAMRGRPGKDPRSQEGGGGCQWVIVPSKLGEEPSSVFEKSPLLKGESGWFCFVNASTKETMQEVACMGVGTGW